MTPTDKPCDGQEQRLLDYGARLKLARKNANLSQDDVRLQSGFPIRSLTRWESGECDPGFDEVASLAKLYRVSLDWLAGITPVEQCILPGTVIVNKNVIELLRSLVDEGKTIRDVPRSLIRNPGIDFCCRVPADALVMGTELVASIQAQVSRLWKQLGGQAT